MRLFCGIEIPAGLGAGLGVGAGLEALIGRLRPLAKLSWTSIEKLHVTTKFIGEWPEERMAEMERALAGVPRPGPVEIGVRGLGWFPNDRNPRVLWAGIEAGDALRDLARDIDHAAAALGVASEEREFNPHLTLARRRDPIPIERLGKEVAAIASHDFGRFSAESFFLYLSKGGRYSKLQEFPLINMNGLP